MFEKQISKLKRMTDFEPAINIDDMLKRAIAYLKDGNKAR